MDLIFIFYTKLVSYFHLIVWGAQKLLQEFIPQVLKNQHIHVLHVIGFRWCFRLGTAVVLPCHVRLPPHAVSPLEFHHRRTPFLNPTLHLPERLLDPLHWEVQHRRCPASRERCLVIRQSRRLGAVKRPQPNSNPMACRVSDFCSILSPRPPPDTSVSFFFGSPGGAGVVWVCTGSDFLLFDCPHGTSWRGTWCLLCDGGRREDVDEEHLLGVVGVEGEGTLRSSTVVLKEEGFHWIESR